MHVLSQHTGDMQQPILRFLLKGQTLKDHSCWTQTCKLGFPSWMTNWALMAFKMSICVFLLFCRRSVSLTWRLPSWGSVVMIPPSLTSLNPFTSQTSGSALRRSKGWSTTENLSGRKHLTAFSEVNWLRDIMLFSNTLCMLRPVNDCLIIYIIYFSNVVVKTWKLGPVMRNKPPSLETI